MFESLRAHQITKLKVLRRTPCRLASLSSWLMTAIGRDIVRTINNNHLFSPQVIAEKASVKSITIAGKQFQGVVSDSK